MTDSHFKNVVYVFVLCSNNKFEQQIYWSDTQKKSTMNEWTTATAPEALAAKKNNAHYIKYITIKFGHDIECEAIKCQLPVEAATHAVQSVRVWSEFKHSQTLNCD